MKYSSEFDRPVLSPKYTNQNLIAKKLVNGFLEAADTLFNFIPKNTVQKAVEIGAGEGHISQFIVKSFNQSSIILTDIYKERLEEAEKRLGIQPNITFQKEDICQLSFANESLDLVVCCEVLEHISNYEKGLNEIYRVVKKNGYFLISVPREPLWRILNMARGKYIRDLGNTPTHINHWSSTSIKKLVQKSGFEVLKIQKPIPWTFLLCKKIK